ncbi:sulfotransferase domain-containing protein [Zhongshania guokunii]|uniref:Sulfotransferase domain-containing protein n=1 Tax=Zhongshania guokunii TaxID=641783 RepID=A0ABV3UAP1_9GAMM
MTFPNLIIAGAPKCGSTSLFNYLVDHPEVCGSDIKETGYLFDKEYPLFKNVKDGRNWYKGGVSGYGDFFPKYNKSVHKVVVEATPDYMYQLAIFDKLAQIPVKPDIVFILRDPAMRAYSLYKYAKNNIGTAENINTFTEFVDLVSSQDKLLNDRGILKNAINHGIYINFIRRWIDELGRHKVHVYLFESMKGFPLEFMKGVAKDIGVRDEWYDGYKFSVENESFAVNSRAIHSRAKSIYRNFGGYVPFKGAAKKAYKYFNTSKLTAITQEETELVNRLREFYLPHNLELASQLSVDISLWR